MVFRDSGYSHHEPYEHTVFRESGYSRHEPYEHTLLLLLSGSIYVNKRLEATRLTREAGKLLEDSESANKKEITNSTTVQLQKRFTPYSSEGKNPC